MTEAATSSATADIETLRAQLAAREERVELLEEENRWLKAQLLGRSSEKTPAEQLNPDQAWLFNEAEALAQAAASAPQSITIPAHERGKRGRKKLDAALPRVEVVHDLPEAEKVCAEHGEPLRRMGEEISEQLDYKPAQVQVIRNVRPKYVCPCCSSLAIAPVPVQLFPKSLATPHCSRTSSRRSSSMVCRCIARRASSNGSVCDSAVHGRPQRLAVQRHRQGRHRQREPVLDRGNSESERRGAACLSVVLTD